MATITHPKFLNPITVHKDNTGYIFYKVSYLKAPVPDVLSGRYSTLEIGVKAVKDYIRSTYPSQAAVVKLHREQRDAAKLRTVSN